MQITQRWQVATFWTTVAREKWKCTRAVYSCVIWRVMSPLQTILWRVQLNNFNTFSLMTILQWFHIFQLFLKIFLNMEWIETDAIHLVWYIDFHLANMQVFRERFNNAINNGIAKYIYNHLYRVIIDFIMSKIPTHFNYCNNRAWQQCL